MLRVTASIDIADAALARALDEAGDYALAESAPA
jgi:hypothetical protein